ncbi:MAG TPA: hypothetical protein VFS40_08400 [Gemmatimonadales bacterium]|nr:hypothetical protein [Gemmatimonadales bacterium]
MSLVAALFNRRTFAALILLVWLGTLGALARRRAAARAAAGIVAGGALRLPPGGAFYAILHEERQVGTLSLALDTTAAGFRLTERLDADLPRGPGGASAPGGRFFITTEAELGRSLELRAFRTVRTGRGARLSMSGEPLSDGRLRLTLTRPRGGGPTTTVLEREGGEPLVLPGLLPLQLAHGAVRLPGDSAAVALFDPLVRRPRLLAARRGADSTFVVPDSAAWDSVAGRWTAAHLDTVPARRFDLSPAEAARPWRLWVDRDGWPVRAEGPDGWVLERSAFELVRTGRSPTSSR